MNPTYDFSGQVALVTGAGAGMGLAEEHQVAALVDRTEDSFGRLDMAFDNAGTVDDAEAGRPIGRLGRGDEIAAAVPWLRTPGARFVLGVMLLAAMSLSACGGADDDGEQRASASEASTPSPRPTSSPSGQDADASTGTPIRVTFGNTELAGRLRDNATARDLAEQLPLTLSFRDHNDAEKTAPLPRRLAVDEAPAGHDPAAGDIGYWAPGGDFVLYYDDDAPYFDGIVRIGEIDGDVQAIRRLPDDADVTIERAD
jgi:hypothetical protein